MKTRAKNNAAPASVSEAPAGAVLQIDQGYGVKAWIDAPYLFLEQDDGEGKTDAICLSRAEFLALIANFGEFAK